MPRGQNAILCFHRGRIKRFWGCESLFFLGHLFLRGRLFCRLLLGGFCGLFRRRLRLLGAALLPVLARRSAINSSARSRVISSALISLGSEALIFPSFTYGP